MLFTGKCCDGDGMCAAVDMRGMFSDYDSAVVTYDGGANVADCDDIVDCYGVCYTGCCVAKYRMMLYLTVVRYLFGRPRCGNVCVYER